MTVRVPLPGGHDALIDDADADRVAGLRWKRTPLGYVARNMYEDGARRTVYLHRFLMGLTHVDKVTVDHINRDRLDNRRANLRVCTQAENCQNVPAAGGSSPFRNVTWDRTRGLWQVQVTVAGKRHKLGRFASEVDAARAAQAFRDAHMPYAQPDPVLAALRDGGRMTNYVVIVFPAPVTRGTDMSWTSLRDSPRVKKIKASSPKMAVANVGVNPGGYALVAEEEDFERFERAAVAPLEQVEAVAA